MRIEQQTGKDDNEQRFVTRFEAELRRLAECGRALTSWEEESLMGALGAASLGEHELACGMITEAKRIPARPVAPKRQLRRQPLAIAALRRRFEHLC